jgi:hypothetical protein
MHCLLFQVSSPLFAAFQLKKPWSSPSSPGSQQVNGIYRKRWRTQPARRRTLQSLSRFLERHFRFSDPVSLKTLARNYSICFFNRGKRGRKRKKPCQHFNLAFSGFGVYIKRFEPYKSYIGIYGI